jgi:acetyl-CoA carboxylase beta subunit
MMKSLSEANHKMGATLIIKCTQCAGLMLTAKGQKTKICPYCGTHVNLLKAQKVAAASNAFEASEMLRKLKNEQKLNHK